MYCTHSVSVGCLSVFVKTLISGYLSPSQNLPVKSSMSNDHTNHPPKPFSFNHVTCRRQPFSSNGHIYTVENEQGKLKYVNYVRKACSSIVYDKVSNTLYHCLNCTKMSNTLYHCLNCTKMSNTLYHCLNCTKMSNTLYHCLNCTKMSNTLYHCLNCTKMSNIFLIVQR